MKPQLSHISAPYMQLKKTIEAIIASAWQLANCSDPFTAGEICYITQLLSPIEELIKQENPPFNLIVKDTISIGTTYSGLYAENSILQKNEHGIALNNQFNLLAKSTSEFGLFDTKKNIIEPSIINENTNTLK